jgi:hypothetical protein
MPAAVGITTQRSKAMAEDKMQQLEKKGLLPKGK